MVAWVFGEHQHWYGSVSVRELVATVVALVTGSWTLIDTFYLKPARRKEHKREIAKLSADLSRGREQVEKSALDAKRFQSHHFRELNALQARHEEQLKVLRQQYENFQYQTAIEAGRSEQRILQLHEAIRSIQLSNPVGAPPSAVVANSKVLNDAVKEAERAAADAPVAVQAPPDTYDKELRELSSSGSPIPPKPTLPAFLSYQAKGYMGLDLVREIAYVDEAAVDQALGRLKEALKLYEVKHGPAVKGDRVTVTGAGYIWDNGNWVTFDGGSLEKLPVVIGSGQLVTGFEDQLIGVRSGDRRYIEVTFPSDYQNARLAARPALFQVNIELVEAPNDFDITDASVRALGFEGIDGLRAVLRSASERDMITASDQRLKRQLLDYLDAANKFDVPEELVKQEHDALWRAQLQELKLRDLPIEALGKPPNEARADLRDLAHRRVRLGIVMTQLASAAAHDGYSVTDEDVAAAVQRQLDGAGPNRDAIAAHFADPDNREALRGPLLEDKITAWLYSKSKIREKVVPVEVLLQELQ